jgi:preprotein translocase subunit SecD
MLHLARWSIVLILAVVVLGFVLVMPNFFARATVDSWPAWMPKNQVVLGLDLQGGAYLLYEVEKDDYIQKRLRAQTSDIRRTLLQDPRIGYTGLGPREDGVQFRVRDLNDLDTVRDRLENLRNPLQTSVFGGTSTYEFDLDVGADGLARMTLNQAGFDQRIRGVVQQSIEVINRRINELGTTEPSIQRQGSDRILVEAPGLGDPQRLKAIIGQTAQLTFHLVRSQILEGQQVPPEPGTIEVPSAEEPGVIYVVDDTPLMTGEDLDDAQTAFDQQTSEPIVNFRLSTSGGSKFAEVTRRTSARPFAIVLDDEVISAPVIREPILGGSGQISGNFTVQTANDLAILLRAGALPARLTVVEERTVGPGLGADSIEAGKNASVYRRSCWWPCSCSPSTAVRRVRQPRAAVNVVLIFGCCRARRDADAARHRRHRADHGHGGRLQRADLRANPRGGRAGRSAITAIDTGFKRALGTILDANITTLDRRGGPVLSRLRSDPRLCRDARDRHHHDRFHRLHLHALDDRVCGWPGAGRRRFPFRCAADGLKQNAQAPPDPRQHALPLHAASPRRALRLSIVLSIISVAIFIWIGPQYGIDFKGGTLIEMKPLSEQSELADIRSTLGGLSLGDVQVQEVSDLATGTNILVRIQAQDGGEEVQQEAIARVRGRVRRRAWTFAGSRSSARAYQANSPATAPSA